MNFDTKNRNLLWLINQLTAAISQDPKLSKTWQIMTDDDKADLQKHLYDTLRYNV